VTAWVADDGPQPTDKASSWTRTTSVEQAVRLCGNSYYPHSLTLMGTSKKFSLTQRVTQIGPITIGDIAYGTDVGLDFAELGSYHVALPIAGCLEGRHRGTPVTATPDLAAVFRPEGETVLTRWHANSRLLAVRFDRAAVVEALGSLLGRPDIVSVPFDATMDTTTGLARSWARTIRALSRQVESPDNVITHPMVAAPLAETVIRGFLLTASHPYRQALTQQCEPPRHQAVRTATETIEASPRSPLTTSLLAAQSHVSVRTLQLSFQRHLGVSPMTYLRMVRLRHAHAELRAADPSHTTVASIAHDWGFTHLGRFADMYASTYGELPSETLRRTSWT
jgi:AraC-like DNA-binding protein